MKAIWQGRTVAEAPKETLIYIEGNWYFPLESVKLDMLRKSPTEFRDPWMGDAQYFDVGTAGKWSDDSAFGFPEPAREAVDRIKRDFSRHIAFWRDVEIVEA